MEIWEAIVLGLVQGLAEFLPISSSGHLAILQHFFSVDDSNALTFTVLLHFGTLVAVFVAFWKDIVELAKELVALFKDIFTGQGPQLRKNETRKLGIMIIIASIPAGIVGILFNDAIESIFTSLILIGICLIITGFLLFFSERMGTGTRDLKKANFRNALFVGICQAIALIPGISRSGATISGGLILGFTREFAVRFAFLVSIPAVLGAFILEIPDAIDAGLTGELLTPTVIGVVVAAVSGYAAIKLMLKVVSGKKLYMFSIYVWIVGAVVLIYSLFM